MHQLILLLIAAALTFEYLAEAGLAPSLAPYVLEVAGIISAVYIVIAGMRSQFRLVRSEYWLLLLGLVLVMAFGALLNSLSSGPLFAGIRTYLRALPLFFLPAVMTIEDRKLRRQMLLVLALSLLQLPLAYEQRMALRAEGRTTGDYVFGTLMGSGLLSVFLICVACVLTGMFARRRMKLIPYLVLLLLVLLPTTLNETKATLVLLPLGLFATLVLGAPRGLRFRNGFVGVCAIIGFGAIFVPIYDYFMTPRWGYGLIEFFTMEGRVESYLSTGAQVGSQQAGRIDAITVPLQELSRDPTTFVLGLGIGNASHSALGEQFVGEYYRRYAPFLFSSSTTVFLETGLLGLLLHLLLYLLVYRDARWVANVDDGLRGALAAGWIGVTVVMAASFFYLNVQSAMSFLFWYFSGVVAARRMQLVAEMTAAPERVPYKPAVSWAKRSDAAT